MSVDFRLIDFNYVFADETDIFVSSENPDFPKENLKNFSRSKVFRTSAITGTQTITFDFKTIEEIDSFVMMFDNLSVPKFDSNTIFKLQASATNVWGAPPVDVTLTLDVEKEVLSHFFSTDQTYRYWRLTIQDPTNAYGYFEVPKIYLGRKIQLTRIPEIGFEFTEEDLSKVEDTAYGHKYFDVYPNRKNLSFQYNLLSFDNLRLISDSFSRVGKVSPVVIVLDAGEELFDKDYFLIYGTYMESMRYSHRFRQYFNLPQTIQELV
jgi:hypothetical protein